MVCSVATSYYIGYLHYNIKGWKIERYLYTFQLKVYSCAQPATCPDGCQQIFVDQLHIVNERPYKIYDRLHKVTDQPHQACVGAFYTNNMSLTCQMVVSCLVVHQIETSECIASFLGPHSAFRNLASEEAGECEHMLTVHIYLVSMVSKCIKMADNTLLRPW